MLMHPSRDDRPFMMRLTLHIVCSGGDEYHELAQDVERPWGRVPAVGEEIEITYGYDHDYVERVVWTSGGCHLWMKSAPIADLADLIAQGFQEQ